MSTPHPSPEQREISELLGSSFGDGPVPRPAAAHLTAGRRSMRRRRALASGASAAGVAAVAVITFSLVGGSSSTTSLAPADEPTAVQDIDGPDGGVVMETGVGEPEKARPKDFGFSGRVGLAPNGQLLKAKGVKVTERIPNPMGYTDPDHSLGIAYERNGESTWALLTYREDPDGTATTGTSSDPARKSFATLQQWIDDQVALQSGDNPPLKFVEFGEGETLVPLDGVEILGQSADVELGSNFAGPTDPTAVAEVVVNAQRWYVLARRIAGSEPEYFPTAAAIGGRTLADFLDFAAQRYAEGGGGLR